MQINGFAIKIITNNRNNDEHAMVLQSKSLQIAELTITTNGFVIKLITNNRNNNDASGL